MTTVPALERSLRLAFVIQDMELPDGTPVRVIEYPLVARRSGDGDGREPEVRIDPDVGGTILGWAQDGSPIAVAYNRTVEEGGAQALDAEFLAAAIRQPYGRDLTARGASHTYGMIFTPLDDAGVRAATIDWLVLRTGCSPEDAAAAADRRYDDFADFARFRGRLLSVVPEFATIRLDARQWRNLAGPDHAGSWVLQIARRWPAFAESLAAGVSPSDPEWQALAARSPAAVVAKLSRDFRHGDPDLRRYDADGRRIDDGPTAADEALAWRMEGLPGRPVEGRNGYDADQWQLFATMREVPRDWWPKTPQEWDGAAVTSRLIYRIELATGLPRRQICAACAGRWKEWASRLAAIAKGVGGSEGYRLDVLGYQTYDAFNAFQNQIVWPIAVRVGAERAPEDGWHTRRLSGRVRRIGAEALFGDASASGILETAVKWHALRPAIDAAIARLSPGHAVRTSWPAALPEFRHRASDGTDVLFVHLTSAAALTDEGARGPDASGMTGLDHCVGSGEYSAACQRGETRIVSLRHRSPDGITARSSTVEFGFRREGTGPASIHLVQHRAIRDRKPCAADAEAVDAFLAAFASGALAIAEAELAPVAVEHDIETICGYDCWDDAVLDRVIELWAPLLRRPLRGLSFREFAAAVGLKEREIELPAHAYLPYVERRRDIFGQFEDEREEDETELDVVRGDGTVRPGLLAGLAALWRRIGGRGRAPSV